MAKDMIGNIAKEGDKIFFQGNIFTIKEIKERRVLGARVTGNRGEGLRVPDEMVIEAIITYDCDKPCTFVIVKTPSEIGAGEA